jgi:hypothetical protein
VTNQVCAALIIISLIGTVAAMILILTIPGQRPYHDELCSPHRLPGLRMG